MPLARTPIALLLLLAPALVAPPTAGAGEIHDAETARARSHLRAGVAYYDEARYEDAAHEMEEAYRLRPLPDLQYNLAQCYERLGRVRDAVAAYRKYLEGKPDAEDRAEIAQRVQNLEERAAKAGSGSAAPAEAPPPVVREKIVLKEVIVYKEAPPKPGRGLRAASYALGALAVVALGGGITFSVLARKNADEVSRGGDPLMPVAFDGSAARAQDSGHQYDVLGFVSYGVAAVAALGTVGLYVLGNKVDRDTAKELSISPQVGPSGAGVSLGGRF